MTRKLKLGWESSKRTIEEESIRLAKLLINNTPEPLNLTGIIEDDESTVRQQTGHNHCSTCRFLVRIHSTLAIKDERCKNCSNGNGWTPIRIRMEF
jgi:hypothetical protein